MIEECLATDAVQFWLDAGVMPQVISAAQFFGDSLLVKIFQFTRHYCFMMHDFHVKLLEIQTSNVKNIYCCDWNIW